LAYVYLETSFFSALVSTRKSAKSIGWRASSEEWWDKEADKRELFISEEVIAELTAPSFPNSRRAIHLTHNLSVLGINNEVLQLADLLVKERVMPGPSVSGDAIHVVTAIHFQMNYILSWNVKHLANENKRTHLAVICMRLGIVPPIIVTPDML